jgi:hypothetical protein
MNYLTLSEACSLNIPFKRYHNTPKAEKWLKQARIWLIWAFRFLDMIGFASWFE